MVAVSPVLAKWWAMLFQPPPAPPAELVEAKRELRTAVVQARLAARQHRQAAGLLERIDDVTDLVRSGDGR